MVYSEYEKHFLEAKLKAEIARLEDTDQCADAATYLPTSVLEAVTNIKVYYDGGNPVINRVGFHQEWIKACQNELIDRIILK